ncbi:undecaprenyl-phosphate glucose phosphotransferase [Salinisphaera sp. USBA-960]|nr:undecaprenyl-phosphate glucose phosphotransferase [Salifodinibacter halophilus]NNC26994.1 undecaprenyl-phosphate glucose phosphotransferase [Salifodinibacter halophilus]
MLKARVDRRRPTLDYNLLAYGILIASDITTILGSGYLAYFLRFGAWTMPPHYRSALAIALITSFVIFPNLRLYAGWLNKPVWIRLQSLILGWGAVALALITIAYMVKESESYSRLWFGTWFLLGGIALNLLRGLATHLLARIRASQGVRRRVVIVGQGAIAERAIWHAHHHGDGSFKVCRVVPLDYDQSTANLGGIESRLLSKRVSLANFVERAGIDEVWFCLALRDEHVLRDFQSRLAHTAVTQRFMPDIDAYRVLRSQITEVAGLTSLNLNTSPIFGANRALKTIEDLVLSALILALISPLLAVIAIAIKLTSAGPALYKQQRVGWNGQEFRMLKFRTMPVHAEAESGPVWMDPSSNRTTRLGQLLRHTSLDELPQFINVIKGDMSIVGPRPERPAFVGQLKHEVPGYMQKHLVKAGITGLAQINGWRGNTDLRKRIEWDLYYIEHWSLWLDLKIIVLTPFKGFMNEHAY